VDLNLGMLLAEMERPAEAEASFRAAFKHDPQSAQAAFNLGVLLAEARPEEALEWCRRAAELRPQEPKYLYTLAFYQYRQGRVAEAVRTLDRVLEQAPATAEVYGLLGRIFEEQRQGERALAVYRRASQNEKLSPEERAGFAEAVRRLSSPP
jgi:tetratricopeptide (TPR) repeat protein